MTPEIGKWYHIEYRSKRDPNASYFGPAKCMMYSEPDNGWGFRFADEPERREPSVFSTHLFKRQDIKHECEPEPTYHELKAEVRRLRSLPRTWSYDEIAGRLSRESGQHVVFQHEHLLLVNGKSLEFRPTLEEFNTIEPYCGLSGQEEIIMIMRDEIKLMLLQERGLTKDEACQALWK